MPLDVREITDEPGLRRYDRLNRESPQGGVFSCRGFLRYLEIDARCVGVFKGDELVAGCLVPMASGKVLRVVPSVPWTGPIARSADEGEDLAAAEGLAGYLLRAFGEATLTMPPEWVDVRGFTWAGFRSHVRYTYRGESPVYEKRLRLRPCLVKAESLHLGDSWHIAGYETGDSVVTVLRDWNRTYYWKANPGGSWHPECLNTALHERLVCGQRDGLGFDMVGCNSPKRGLFKRAFGGHLTPYFVVTTADPKEIAEFWPPQEAAVA